MPETEKFSSETPVPEEVKTTEILTPTQIDEQVLRLHQLDQERADLGYELYQLTGKPSIEREKEETCSASREVKG